MLDSIAAARFARGMPITHALLESWAHPYRKPRPPVAEPDARDSRTNSSTARRGRGLGGLQSSSRRGGGGGGGGGGGTMLLAVDVRRSAACNLLLQSELAAAGLAVDTVAAEDNLELWRAR